MSAEKIVAFPKASVRVEEAGFLPAALEILETPASPAGRAVAAVIIAIFVLFITWASLSHVDIIASAPGKIVPTGGTKLIQSLDAGLVRDIHVHDGQRVRAGDVLIELDPTINELDRDHQHADLVATKLEIARLTAVLADEKDPLAAFQPPVDATPAQVETQREFLSRQITEYRAKIEALERQLDQKQAERTTILATVGKLSAIIPILQQRVDIRKASSDQEYTSRFQYLEMLQLLVEQQQELLVQNNHVRETEASIAALVQSRIQAIAEFHRTLFAQLTEAERKADGFSYDITKSDQKIASQYLRAPIDGTVQQLAVHTVGGVVSPAQTLLAVVPLDSRLEIEATVLNRDVGFVHAKQSAEIKVDTFNFTKYGLLHGEVLSVSQDAVPREKPVDRASEKSLGAESTSSEPKSQELNFVARVSLDRAQMQVDDQLVSLKPGMAVTVEVKTGTRSIISYILSPFVKYGHESLRER